jgi:hypothetical protein
MIEVSERTRCERDRGFLGDHAAHGGADQVGRLDAERIHQPGGVLGHVAELVGRLNRDLQEPKLEQFERGQALAARQVAGFADVAVVEADDAESAACKLTAEFVVPQDHLGPQPHDQQHRLGAGVAEALVTNIDAVGAGDLGRLVG